MGSATETASAPAAASTGHRPLADLATKSVADPDFVRAVNDVFADYRATRPAPAVAVELDRALWSRLDELGLTRLTGAEEHGGSGGAWPEAAALLGIAAAAGAPVPLAEHDLLAGWLLESAGLPHDGGIRTVGLPDADGSCRGVPWAGVTDGLVLLWQDDATWRVCDVPTVRTEVTGGRDLAGLPRGRVLVDLDVLRQGTAVPQTIARELRLRGALARCAQVSGAMGRVLTIVLSHVQDRTQFGRPIGRFQAVQHLLADVAAEAALARAATDAAVATVVQRGWGEAGTSFSIAVAKSTVGHSASVVVRNAHQALGALGTTLEHELHTATKPILVWRNDFGSVHSWDAELAQLAAQAGRDGLWELITGTGPRASTGGRR
jgi:acyl-CoA dehydrogenase